MKPLRLLTLSLAICSCHMAASASDDYKQEAEYLALRDSMSHAFNNIDSARFSKAVAKLEQYLLDKNDLHAYYTQRCNEIVFLINRQNIIEAYKQATRLSKELRERKLDDEMYMAVNMMGHINRYCGNKEAACRCFYEVIERMEKAGYRESMPPIYMNIANVEMDDDPEEALRIIDRAAQIAKETSPERLFEFETRRTLAYYKMGDMKKFTEGYNAFREGVARGETSVHGRTMEIYHQALIGNVDEAVKLARDYLGSESHEMVAMLYKDAARWKEAFDELEAATASKDSLNAVILSNSMQGIQDELRLYEAERQAARYQVLTLAAVVVALVLLLLALGYITMVRRRYLRRLKAAYRRALESDKIKSAFIQNVSHEVRTPLNIIAGFAQVISNPDMVKPEELRHIAGMVLDNTKAITTQIDDLLELSISEAGGEVIKEDVVEVDNLMGELMKESKRELASGTVMRFESALPDAFKFSTNQPMLKRIISSLLNNAVKNTPQGHILLSTALADTPATTLVITVEDTGCGIPASEAEHIFERFVKLDDFKKGFGLGLPLSRTLAQRLGGNVVLDIAYGGPGARFVVTLPVE